MEDLQRGASDKELSAMLSLLEDSLAAGAAGFSTGLFYRPAEHAPTEEVIALVKAVGAAGAGVFALADASIPSDFWPPFLWGMAASALTGYVAVWGTLKLVRSHTFAPFVVYRIVVGVAVLLILTTGWR